MKFAYRIIKNKKNTGLQDKNLSKVSTAGAPVSVVSFILVAKVTLGFRECAKMVKIAQDTNCKVEIASGSKSGTSDSILSLATLEISANKSLVLTIRGERNAEALKGISKIISGETEL